MSTSNTQSTRKLKLAVRGKKSLNVIRAMFMKANAQNVIRQKEGLKPLLSLGLGAPHIPANPLLDIAVEEFTSKKLKLQEKAKSLQQQLEKNSDDPKLMAELTLVNAALVKEDTYQVSQGTEYCRQTGADLINHYYPNVKAIERNVVVTCGATHGLSLVLQALVEEGVSIGCFSPYFPTYGTLAISVGGKFVPIPTLDNCRPSAEILDQYLKDHPEITVFILNDPCNPTGVKLTRKELQDIADVFDKPENRDIIIVCDEVYHELVYSECKDMFLNVVDPEKFKNRTCIVLATAKDLAGSPGFRSAYLYAPDMMINGKMEQMGTLLGNLVLDSTCGVTTVVQYATNYLIKAKLGKTKPEHVEICKNWEEHVIKTYSSAIRVGGKALEDAGYGLVVAPEGAFFGIIDAKKLVGKKVPSHVTTLDGRTISDLVSKVGVEVLSTDVEIALYFLYAAEVVTIAASGFGIDPTKGRLRVSFAQVEDVLKEAAARLKHAGDQAV